MSDTALHLDAARYTWGGDEFLFVEIAEGMSLAANFKANAMAAALGSLNLSGITDICPANASLLIRFDPDDLPPDALEEAVRGVEAEVAQMSQHTLQTRIIEVPVWYDDPYTRETGARFRKGHQRPEGNDLDFAAEENNLASPAEFIKRHHESPWLVSMVGFVAGL
ncbi:carboxyltransferase domain-containing protein, partial [Arthrobacter sp. H5]|uniref:5-oxoprolinase subunit B family protein n=1 Tax=Arthrobacter sp. H5 TaxID=1267973 RepID=UPI00055AFD4D